MFLGDKIFSWISLEAVYKYNWEGFLKQHIIDQKPQSNIAKKYM